ncbi:protein D1-like [Maniola hyperantus]|uniref:protein D1-like n=1 Tax=Aphantopus hyperantus TaxID=2795564 RepID=UPI003747A7B2
MLVLVWCAAFALVSPARVLGAVIPEELDIRQAFTDFALGNALDALLSELLSMRFGSREVMLGTNLCPFDTIIYPFLAYEASSRSLYTLMCINPDIGYYKNRTYELSALLFLAVNIPGDSVEDGDLLSGFKPALPIPGSGATRNACVVYRQPRRITVNTQSLTEVVTNITQFNHTAYLKDNRIGNPIAGNFYLTELTVCRPDSGGSCGGVCNYNCCSC